MSENKNILLESYKSLLMKKEILIEKIEEYNNDIRRYQECNIEISEEEIIKISNSDIAEIENKINFFEESKNNLNETKMFYNELKNNINDIINFNISYGNIITFCDKIFDVPLAIDFNLYDSIIGLGKSVSVKFPYTKKDIDMINKNASEILSLNFQLKNTQTINAYFMPIVEKNRIIDEIKKKIVLIKDLYSKSILFIDDVLLKTDSIIIRLKEDIINIQNEEIDNRKKEIIKNIDELTNKKNKCEEGIKEIDEVIRLYDEFNKNPNYDSLIILSNKFVELDVLSHRAAKKIIYKPKENEKSKEIKEVKAIVKQETNEIIQPLDSDYFRRKNTKRIICFLGDNDDSIQDDINSHFDNSKKHIVVNEFVNLFNNLYSRTDHFEETGGNPKYFSDKKTVSLLRNPYNFNYRRYGVSKDQFRIHAIERHSELLERLGYGEGNIIFFGAVGINDDKKKSDAYARLGRRAIEYLSETGSYPKLRPSFNYIEHITRGYIPLELLSQEDILKVKKGVFNGKLKSTEIDKSTENFKYILYDALDDLSKKNVIKYLDNYFLDQSNKMFEIIEVQNKKKGNTLD